MPALTYGFEPGTVLTEERPAGYRRRNHWRDLGPADRFDEVVGAVLDWQVQRRSGIAVRGQDDAAAPPVREGLVGRLVIPMPLPGQWRAEVSAPFRVVRVLATRDAGGFVYGTLPGHPETGEEAFLVHRIAGRTVLELRVLSRTAFPFVLAAPAARAVQQRYTERYLAALA